MPRLWTIAVITLALSLHGALAKPKPAEDAQEPSFAKDAISHAAKVCTEEGGFGHLFAGMNRGTIDATAGDEWAPFVRLHIAGHTITATADFTGTADSAEEDAALTGKFFKAFDKAVTEKHKFPHREHAGSSVVFHTSEAPGSGLVFELQRDDARVLATCSDLGD